MNNTLEKELNEYREDLQELTNSDLLIEYKYSCIEVERLRKLFRNNSDNKNLQNSLDYEKQIEKICMDNIISRMGVHKKCPKMLKNGETEFNLIRLHSRNGVSLLAKTRKDNTLVEYLVEENSNNGKRVYGVGDDLHVAFITFLSFIEIDN